MYLNKTKVILLQMYMCAELLSHVQLFATPWNVACQTPLSMGFSRQGYWDGMPFPFPGDLPDPGIEPGSLALQAYSLPSELPGKPNRGSKVNKENHICFAQSRIIFSANLTSLFYRG